MEEAQNTKPNVSEGKLSFGEKAGYGAGALAESNMQNALNIMIMPIMNVGMGVNPVLLGYSTAIGRLWDAISDPLAGYFSDKTSTRWGRRKPYLVTGAFLAALSFIVIWLFPAGRSEYWYFYYFTGLSLLYYTSTTLFCVPYISLGFELSDSYHERTQLMCFRTFFVSAGALALPWMFWFTQRSWFSNSIEGMRYLSIIVGLAFIGFGLCPIFFTKTLKHGMTAPSAEYKTSKLTVGKFFTVLKIKPFLLVVVTLGCSIVGSYTVGILGLYIVIYYICGGDQKTASTIQGFCGTAFALSAIAAIPLINHVSKKLGKRNALMIFLGIAGIGSLLKLVLYTPQYPYLCILISIFLAQGMALWTLLFSMVSDICDYDELMNGLRREGVFAAILSWVAKAGMTVCGIFAGYVLVGSGFDKALGTQSETTNLYMRLWFALVPATGFLLSIIMMTFYPLTENKVNRIKMLLEKKKHRRVPPMREEPPELRETIEVQESCDEVSCVIQ